MYTPSADSAPQHRLAQIMVTIIVGLIVLGAAASQSGLIDGIGNLWVRLFSSPEAEYYKSGLTKLNTLDRANLEPALQDFTQALALNPKYTEAYIRRGIVYRLLRLPEESVADFSQAIALEPGNAEAYFERASSAAELGQIQEPLDDLNKAIELKGDYFEAFYVRGSRYIELQEYDKALADLNQAISLKPWRVKPDQEYTLYVNRGLGLLATGKLDEALADFDKTVTIYPEQAQPYRNRGNAYLQKQQFKEAATDFLKSLELEPDFDLSPVLADFQNRLVIETDPTTKAQLEKLIAKATKQ